VLQVKASDLNSLFKSSMDIMLNTSGWEDAFQTPRILSYNNLLFSESTDFTFDLSHVGFTKTRWARYVHQYIDRDQLDIWLNNLKGISKRGDNLFRSKDAIRRPREHHHGSCWLGLSYRSLPPTLVLYSRVAEFPTRVALEFTMVHKVGLELKERLNLTQPVQLVWFISSLFFSCLHALPYLAINNLLEITYSRKDSIGSFVRHQCDHIARGNVRYGPTKRMAKRLQQIQDKTVKSVPIDKLSIWI